MKKEKYVALVDASGELICGELAASKKDAVRLAHETVDADYGSVTVYKLVPYLRLKKQKNVIRKF